MNDDADGRGWVETVRGVSGLRLLVNLALIFRIQLAAAVMFFVFSVAALADLRNIEPSGLVRLPYIWPVLLLFAAFVCLYSVLYPFSQTGNAAAGATIGMVALARMVGVAEVWLAEGELAQFFGVGLWLFVGVVATAWPRICVTSGQLFEIERARDRVAPQFDRSLADDDG